MVVSRDLPACWTPSLGGLNVFARRMLFSLVLLGLVAPVSAQEATLEWKLAKDKTFYQTMTTETKQTMKVMGTETNREDGREPAHRTFRGRIRMSARRQRENAMTNQASNAMTRSVWLRSR